MRWGGGWSGEGGTEGSGVPKGMVTCTETKTAKRGLGSVNTEENASCPKDNTSLELKGPIWAREQFRVFCNYMQMVDVAG